MQSKTDEVNSSEGVRIYHHELHAKHIKKSSILKLNTENGILEGHEECRRFLEESVSKLLSEPVALDINAQNQLLSEVSEVFTEEDNAGLIKEVTKEEVKKSVFSSNLNAAPGTDGLTNVVYKSCWNIIGDALTEVTKAVLGGDSPPVSQRT